MAARYFNTITLANKNTGAASTSETIAAPITNVLFSANNWNHSWLYNDVKVDCSEEFVNTASPTFDSTGAMTNDNKAKTADNAKNAEMLALNINNKQMAITPSKLKNELTPASIAKVIANEICDGAASEFKILSNFASMVSTRFPCSMIGQLPIV